MCLLLVLHRAVPGYPIVVAANRDEAFARKSLPPRILSPASTGEPAILAPMDEVAGGTWIGVNAAGLFVGVTNRPPGTPDPTRRSRGLLALEVLRQPDAEAALRFLETAADPRRYNPFNLIWSDGRTAHVLHVDDAVRREDLLPGVHVLSNLDDVNKVFVTEILRAYDPIAASRSLTPREFVRHLQRICRDHALKSPRGHAICKHHESRGTVSSTILRIPTGASGDGMFLHAPGPPCRTRYEDLSALLSELPEAASP